MKNITIALDDETYRKARIIAAQRDSSVSALVKNYLVSLSTAAAPIRDFKQEQETLLDSIWSRHPAFSSRENLPREALHERHALR